MPKGKREREKKKELEAEKSRLERQLKQQQLLFDDADRMNVDASHEKDDELFGGFGFEPNNENALNESERQLRDQLVRKQSDFEDLNNDMRQSLDAIKASLSVLNERFDGLPLDAATPTSLPAKQLFASTNRGAVHFAVDKNVEGFVAIGT
eukprot:107347_1